jgi:signal transduction histidine kinase
MFDRFFRASNAGNIPGTGLGLNIVRRYVDLLGGSITFSSEYRKGTTFVVSIPESAP